MGTDAEADSSAALAALSDGSWVEAAEAFAQLAAATSDPVASEGLAQAAWWLDDATVSLDAREAAYRGFRAAGDDRGAARTAAALGYDSVLFGRGAAVGRGWLARAADVLGGRVDVPEAGWLAVREAELALNVDRDAATALDASTRGRQIGRELGDADLVMVAQALGGLASVRLGRLEAGMKQLDAAAAAAGSGDVEDLMWIGKIYCWLIVACQATHDLERAGEWCARVEELSVRRQLDPLFAVCRTQYASILLARGDHDGAESALTDVLSRIQQSRRLSRLDAVAQLGELRRRQGRLAEADDLLRQAGYVARALTSLAQVRLDEGNAARAWAIITELLRSMAPEDLERVDALAVAVAAGVAAGHLDEARSAADQLGDLAIRVPTDAFRAEAAAADGRLAHASAAVERWQVAARLFHKAGLYFNEADSRIELAEALLSEGDRDGARDQADLALRALGPLQSGRAIDHARGLLGPLTEGPRSRRIRGQLTDRQTDVLGLLARGLSNADIAAQLHLSEHTVHRHIANIYRVLDVGSRAAAASYAARHGLT